MPAVQECRAHTGCAANVPERPRSRRENGTSKHLSPVRRKLLIAGAAFASVPATPGLDRARNRSPRVGVYRGCFKNSFDAHVFPAFIKATSIAAKSIAAPTPDARLFRLEQAARAGQTPAHACMMSQVAMLKGQGTELWSRLGEARLSNLGNLHPQSVNRHSDGAVAGVGAVAW